MRKIIILLLLSIFVVACTTQTTEKVATACPPDCQGGNAGVLSTVNSPADGGNVYGGSRPYKRYQSVCAWKSLLSCVHM